MIWAAFLAVAPLAASASEESDRDMAPILASYLSVQDSLAADSLDGVATSAKTIAEAAGRLDPPHANAARSGRYAELPSQIVASAHRLSTAETIESAREAFKELSRPMVTWASMAVPAGVSVVYCPMAQASWLQKSGQIRNPYFGSEMLRCGEVVPPAGADHGHGDHGSPADPRS